MKFKIGDKVIEMVEDDGLSKKDIVKSVFDALKENAHKVKHEPYVEIVHSVHAISEDGTAYGTVGVLNEDGDMEACHWDYKDGKFTFSRKKGEVSEEILKRREEIESKLIDAIADKSTDEAEAKAMGFAHDAECKDEEIEEEEFKKYKGLARVKYEDIIKNANDEKKEIVNEYISGLPFIPFPTDEDVTVVYVDKKNGVLIIDGEEAVLDESVEDSKKKSVKDVKLISDITDYVPWSGARETWDKIVAAKKLNELDAILEDIYPEGLTMNELNDLLWFEDKDVLNWLGISEEVEDSCKKDAYREPANEEDARELFSYITTSSRVAAQIYRQRIEPIINNLARKIKRGIFDENLAVKAFTYAADDGAKAYEKEYGGHFNPATRERCAEMLLDEYREQIEELGEEMKSSKKDSCKRDALKDYWMNRETGEVVSLDEIKENYDYSEWDDTSAISIYEDWKHIGKYDFDDVKKRHSSRDAKSKKVCDICGQEVKDIEKIGQHFFVCPECKRHMKESDIELLK